MSNIVLVMLFILIRVIKCILLFIVWGSCEVFLIKVVFICSVDVFNKWVWEWKFFKLELKDEE